MTTSIPEELQGLPLFSSLDQEQLARVLDRHLETSHEPDQVIVMEQDWGESLFLLRSGLAKVRTYTMDGDEVVMSLLGEGDLLNCSQPFPPQLSPPSTRLFGAAEAEAARHTETSHGPD